MSPAEVAEALPIVRGRCEEIGRDPATLAVSVHIWAARFSKAGPRRAELLAGYKDVGVDRVQGLDLATATSDEALESVAEDARAAGVELATQP
jgi:hypothetical protein